MVTKVRTVGDAFRQNRRIVIWGGPGSGKSTLGRWLALKFATGLLRQLDIDVAPERHAYAPAGLLVRTPEGVPFCVRRRQF